MGIWFIYYFAHIVSAVCLWALLSAILINFFFSRKSEVRIKKEKKSVVETGSMFGFFIITFIFGITKIGQILLSTYYSIYLAAIGAILIVAGTTINLVGRLNLKGNWGNQIRIYEDHTLVNKGIYKYIRHPLYSSTILMLYGSSLLFTNILVFALNSAVFLPFMVYRSKQEDVILHENFGESYDDYKSHTGMLLPKINRRGKKK